MLSILSSSFVTVNRVSAQSQLNILGETLPVAYVTFWDFTKGLFKSGVNFLQAVSTIFSLN
jgi:hypothetical protein